MEGQSVVLTIDAGLNGTGVAIWTSRLTFIKALNLYAPKKLEWQDKGHYIISKILQQRTCGYNIKNVYVEYPAFFQSVGGEMVARRGDLVKLTWFVGLVCGVFYPIKVNLITVMEWKGQLPKEVVERRIKKAHPEYVGYKDHCIDAIGIGLYVKGEFK